MMTVDYNNNITVLNNTECRLWRGISNYTENSKKKPDKQKNNPKISLLKEIFSYL